MIGRHIESDPAGASQRYENPRDAYDDSIRQFRAGILELRRRAERHHWRGDQCA